jgi:Uma2 family endonuclease
VKLPLYEETGVLECWVMDPKTKTVEVYVLRDEQHALLGRWGPGERARLEAPAGFEAALDAVMETQSG